MIYILFLIFTVRQSISEYLYFRLSILFYVFWNPKSISPISQFRLLADHFSENNTQIRCFCNQPDCVPQGYMCLGKACFTKLPSNILRLKVESVYSGCLIENLENRKCPKGFLCCSQDLCNHVDDPAMKNRFNKTIQGSLIVLPYVTLSIFKFSATCRIRHIDYCNKHYSSNIEYKASQNIDQIKIFFDKKYQSKFLQKILVKKQILTRWYYYHRIVRRSACVFGCFGSKRPRKSDYGRLVSDGDNRCRYLRIHRSVDDRKSRYQMAPARAGTKRKQIYAASNIRQRAAFTWITKSASGLRNSAIQRQSFSRQDVLSSSQ